jgi:spermidine/putrescine transport system substrate-binding protein
MKDRRNAGRFFRAGLTALLILSGIVSLGTENAKAAPRELVFFTWAEYMDPELIAAFEKKYNARIKQVFYETDELKEEMLIRTDGKGFDVVLTSGISAVTYRKKNWLLPLDEKKVPNLKHIDRRWLTAHKPLAGYAAPYLWGTLGIAYRKDLVKETVDSWRPLYVPAETLRNKIVMINDSNDAIGAALKYLGHSLNSSEPQHYVEVEKLLLRQKPFVNEYSYVAVNEDAALVKGSISMAMVYNGDALVLKEIEPQIAYCVPREGTNLWIDYLVIMKGSQQKELAADFIDFLNEPRNAAQLAETLMFASPNKAAEAHLSDEHLSNPLIYPDKAVLEKSEIARPLPPRILKRRNTLFANILR